MDDSSNSKPWYASSTIWGGLVAVAAPLVGYLGYSISAADQASAIVDVVQVAGGIGGLIAIVGRVLASKKIGSKSS